MKTTILICGGVLSIGLLGCQDERYDLDASDDVPAQAKAIAVAELSPASGSNVRGSVTFTPEADGLRVTGTITGLMPGRHGFHVHEKGDCSAPDASSAGDHFNPTGQPHGAPGAGHVGDLGNIVANEEGVAEISEVFDFVSLSGASSIVGKALVVHEHADDFSAQPSGEAGKRLACGVIRSR